MLTSFSAKNWNYESAAHLLNRAGFGGTPNEIAVFQAKGLDAAVDSLLQPPNDSPPAAGEPWTIPKDFLARRQEIDALKSQPVQLREKKKEMRREEGEEFRELRAWWLDRMLTTHAPLREKMTLFWHGHFATSAQKVKVAYAMWLQNESFRHQSLGNFTTLLKAVSRDPAMMIYLDLFQSKQEHPNENWAREVMELFTLGIGHYTEQDVRESARAFTGYRIDFVQHKFRFAPFQHGSGEKKFLGHTGNFNGDDILDLIVQQPACPRFLGRKLWRYFVEDEPADVAVENMAALLRKHDFEMRPVLREIFSSREFYSEGARRTQIKSPVQFLVQSCKLLETDLPAANVTDGAMRVMGQLLLAPPNVKGWDGGKSWVSTGTLLFRYNFSNYLISGTSQVPNAPPKLQRPAIDVAKLVPNELRKDPAQLVQTLSQRLFQAKPAPKQTDTFVAYLKSGGSEPDDEKIRRLMHLMMSTPQYQLT
ncbi:MAG: DUF1800 domain-containing protein [Chthoniobacterales bacterium]|nr:DUF1800 domain-containing protein [Chthoniobacterales bacterium]